MKTCHHWWLLPRMSNLRAANIVCQWNAKNFSRRLSVVKSPSRQNHLRELGNVEQEGKASKEVHHEHPW